MFLFGCVFRVSADLRTFQRSPSYTAAVQGQEREEIHYVTFVCVVGVCVCALAQGVGLTFTRQAPGRRTLKHKVTQSAQTPSLEQFSPSNSRAESPAVSKTRPQEWSRDRKDGPQQLASNI